jgi:hypothetical protein
MNAMEEKKHKSQSKIQITDFIFKKLESSPANTWSSALDPKFYTIPKSVCKFKKPVSYAYWDDLDEMSLYEMINPDNILKHTLIYSGQRAHPEQHCSIFIKKKRKIFFSKIFFDENGDLDHIDTQITLKGQKKIEKFETGYGISLSIADDQTECEEIITNEDKTTWSFITKKMPFDEFIKKFNK